MKSGSSRWSPGLCTGVLVSLLSVAHLVWPVLAAPASRMVGDLQTEVASHAPPLAASLQGLSRFGPFVRAEHPLAADVATAAALEPTTVLSMAPVFRLAGGGTAGFALAWNFWQVMVVAASAAGCALGARALLPRADLGGWGTGVAMVAGANALFLHRFADAGRTEAQNYGFYALHMGLLLTAARESAGMRRRWWWVAAALSLVPTLWSGGYAAVFVAFTEPLLAMLALSIAESRRVTWIGLGATAAVAMLAIAPLGWALHTFPYVGVAGRAATSIAPSFDLSLLLTDHFIGGRDLPGYEVPPFAGWALMASAALAVVWGGRAVRIAVAIGVICLWEASGPAPKLFDRAAWSPTTLWVAAGGPLALVRGWSRIIAFGIPFLAIAAGTAASARPRLALVTMTALLAETVARSPQRWWSLDFPPETLAISPTALQIPLDTWTTTRRWLVVPPSPDPTMLSPDRPLLAWLRLVVPDEPERLHSYFKKPPVTIDPCVLILDAIALRNEGYASIRPRPAYLWTGADVAINAALVPVFGEPVNGEWPLPTDPGECAVGEHVWSPDALARPGTKEERAAARAAERAAREEERRNRGGEGEHAEPGGVRRHARPVQ